MYSIGKPRGEKKREERKQNTRMDQDTVRMRAYHRFRRACRKTPQRGEERMIPGRKKERKAKSRREGLAECNLDPH